MSLLEKFYRISGRSVVKFSQKSGKFSGVPSGGNIAEYLMDFTSGTSPAAPRILSEQESVHHAAFVQQTSERLRKRKQTPTQRLIGPAESHTLRIAAISPIGDVI